MKKNAKKEMKQDAMQNVDANKQKQKKKEQILFGDAQSEINLENSQNIYFVIKT